jgi:hypothetical protein
MLRIPHCLDNRLTDSGEVVSLTHRLRYTPLTHFLFVSLVLICQRMSKPLDLVRPEGQDKLLKFNYINRS